MPFFRTVFGYSPVPQMMKEPKSLYQSPSGAHGSVTTQFWSRCRSSRVIARSATRSRMCSHTARGRLAKRIFGSRASPEDRSDQIFAGFAFPRGIAFRHELLVSSCESGPRRRFGLDSAFRKRHQRPAHRHVALFRHAPDFTRKRRRHRHALPDGAGSRPDGCFASSLHNFIMIQMHHTGALCTYSSLSTSYQAHVSGQYVVGFLAGPVGPAVHPAVNGGHRFS